jgi:hypothetical protein
MTSSLPLPLLNLFNLLRRQGWVLGIDDYLSALSVVETGIGVGDREQLKQICTVLWSKTPQEVERLSQLLDRLSDRALFTEKTETQSPKDTPTSFPSPRKTNLPDDPVEKVQAEIQAEAKDLEIAESLQSPELSRSTSSPTVPYRFRRDYFPVTSRQMKQSWRFLRLPVREGVPTELDIKATITQVSREGIFSTPVLRPRRYNRADLLLLIDQKGSMVPFHPLCRQLIETAIRDGKLRQVNVYYFQNCPQKDEKKENYLLFRQATLFQPISLRELSITLDRRTVVLIVSDAGAARGWLDRDRIEETEKFLARLQPLVRYRAWLNPMPSDCWKGTSAAAIARTIPMFSLSRQGLNQAIAVLQGRYLTGVEVEE